MCVFSNLFFKLTVFTIAKLNSALEVRKDLKAHPKWSLLDRGDDCGQSVTDRIIGGEVASLGQYPWIALLGYSFELDPDVLEVNVYECGGTIISDRYVVTAAHCSPDFLGVTLAKVRLGEHSLKQDPDCESGECAPPVQDMDVESVTCHPGHNKKTLQDDICLIRLAETIQFNDYVYPICLPTYDVFKTCNFENMVMEVAGWGMTDIRTEKKSDVLLNLNIPVISRLECAKSYKKPKITSKQICAGGVIGKDSCGGDSGGPLMKPFSIEGPPRYFLIGIVSFGPKKCAESTKPGVYTKVSEYLEWILDNITE